MFLVKVFMLRLASFTGCAGQRCMAASVLLTIGPQKDLLSKIVDKAKKIVPYDQTASQEGVSSIGPVINPESLEKIKWYTQKSIDDGAELLLDGRNWKSNSGNFIGPTIIKHKKKSDIALHDEIFGQF